VAAEIPARRGRGGGEISHPARHLPHRPGAATMAVASRTLVAVLGALAEHCGRWALAVARPRRAGLDIVVSAARLLSDRGAGDSDVLYNAAGSRMEL
jgi:hypothetical protein